MNLVIALEYNRCDWRGVWWMRGIPARVLVVDITRLGERLNGRGALAVSVGEIDKNFFFHRRSEQKNVEISLDMILGEHPPTKYCLSCIIPPSTLSYGKMSPPNFSQCDSPCQALTPYQWFKRLITTNRHRS